MSRYHDDSTAASNPVELRLSPTKLRRLCPRLFGLGALLPSSLAWRDRIAEHLSFGDTRAAVVVQTSPFRVAAYTDELDCAVLLAFPDRLATELRLQTGDRLLTVNTYGQDAAVAADLQPGPGNLGRWTNYFPLIADFLSDDAAPITARKHAISEQEWKRTAQCGRELLARGAPARSGDPTLSWRPATDTGTAAAASDEPGPLTVFDLLSSLKFLLIALLGIPGLFLAGHVKTGLVAGGLFFGVGALFWLSAAGRLRRLNEPRMPDWLGYVLAFVFTIGLVAAILYFARVP